MIDGNDDGLDDLFGDSGQDGSFNHDRDLDDQDGFQDGGGRIESLSSEGTSPANTVNNDNLTPKRTRRR